MNTIRCSMLPAWDDCARRTGGRQFGALLAGHGHNLRELLPSVGAAVGTAVHAGAAYILTARLVGNRESFTECVDTAFESLSKQLKPGAVWDATTPNMGIAYQQVERMLKSHIPTLADVKPLIVESEMKSAFTENWEISGHVDDFTEDGTLDDLKTGVPPRTYIAQIGGYILNLEANGHKVNTARMTFVQRVRLKKPQPPPVRTEYDLATARRVAWRAIVDIANTMDEYERTGNPDVIRANAMSLMCSEKYCSSWGTSFCDVYQKPKEK